MNRNVNSAPFELSHGKATLQGSTTTSLQSSITFKSEPGVSLSTNIIGDNHTTRPIATTASSSLGIAQVKNEDDDNTVLVSSQSTSKYTIIYRCFRR